MKKIVPILFCSYFILSFFQNCNSKSEKQVSSVDTVTEQQVILLDSIPSKEEKEVITTTVETKAGNTEEIVSSTIEYKGNNAPAKKTSNTSTQSFKVKKSPSKNNYEKGINSGGEYFYINEKGDIVNIKDTPYLDPVNEVIAPTTKQNSKNSKKTPLKVQEESIYFTDTINVNTPSKKNTSKDEEIINTEIKVEQQSSSSYISPNVELEQVQEVSEEKLVQGNKEESINNEITAKKDSTPVLSSKKTNKSVKKNNLTSKNDTRKSRKEKQNTYENDVLTVTTPDSISEEITTTIDNKNNDLLEIIYLYNNENSSENINDAFSVIEATENVLYIIDGTRIDNINFPLFIRDIDPSIINNISFIKGYSAYLLFGRDAENGAILINSKSGSDFNEFIQKIQKKIVKSKKDNFSF